MGRFWARNRVWRFTRIVFGAIVQGALLSGLTALVLSEAQELRLDRALIGFARKIMGGDACTKVEEQDEEGRPALDEHGKAVVRYRALSDTVVFRRVGVAPARVELRVRRLRQHRRWIRYPERRPQEIGAIFG
eukprot:4177219-Pyramimonas_sp.AAC.1